MKDLTTLNATERHTVITDEIFKHKHELFERLRQVKNTIRGYPYVVRDAKFHAERWSDYKAKRRSEGYDLTTFKGYKQAQEYADRIAKL
jgi:hypothetical protein